VVVALLLGVALSGAIPESVYQDAFVSWMTKFDKSYAPEEFFSTDTTLSRPTTISLRDTTLATIPGLLS